MAADTYNWTSLDTWVNTHFAAGRRTVYTIYGTPDYLKTSSTLDAYNQSGGASVPSDSAVGYPALQAFVTALINRYNDGTPSGRKIHMIEAWNEPDFDGNESGFWWGTAPQMVDMSRAIVLARNASVDTGVKVLSPGIVDGAFPPGGILDTFLGASSAMEPATKGKDWLDEVALHLYNNGYGKYWTAHSDVSINNMKTILASHGLSARPWHVSEEGVDWRLPVDTDIWPSMSDAQRGLWQARHVVLQGLLGAQTVCLYAHDNELSGDFRKPALAAAIHRVHTEVAGKTITSAQFRFDGSLDLIADGQLVRI